MLTETVIFGLSNGWRAGSFHFLRNAKIWCFQATVRQEDDSVLRVGETSRKPGDIHRI